MEAKEPLRPSRPRIRLTPAGLGAAAAPMSCGPAAIVPAQRTAVVDGVKLATRTFAAA